MHTHAQGRCVQMLRDRGYVVDQGDIRRGRPSAHVVYGNAVSVLAGAVQPTNETFCSPELGPCGEGVVGPTP